MNHLKKRTRHENKRLKRQRQHDAAPKLAPRVVSKIAAQGDVMFVRVDALPKGLVKKASGSRVIVAHSETGHHHVAVAERLAIYGNDDPMICYLVNETGRYADIDHERPHDTHQTFRLEGPVWKVVRQREAAPEGWRRVAD